MRSIARVAFASATLLLLTIGSAAAQRGGGFHGGMMGGGFHGGMMGNGFHGGHFHDGHFHDGHFHGFFPWWGFAPFAYGVPYRYPYPAYPYPYYAGYYYAPPAYY
jgi:hypothetical protein